jgi:ferrous iron transport protein A
MQLAYTNYMSFRGSFLILRAKGKNMTQTAETSRPLSEIKTGDLVTLQTIQVGRELSSRLTSLGLTPGASIEMLQNFGRGPLIVNVRGTHVALGRGEAARLLVYETGQR